jgi:proprotein convertase subtilisin/kexin type 5
VACAGDCKTCSVTTTNCTSCKILNLEGNACVSNCTVGSIPISQICTSCLGGLSPQKYLTANTCQQTCPNFTYPNSSTLTCASCVSPCSLCTAFSSCLSCATSFFLEGTNCVSNCSVSFTGVAGLCQACTNNCKTCSGATNFCLTCNSGTYFLNATNSCVTNCNPGLFIDYSAQACVGCTSPCNTCTNTSTTCTSCTTGYLLLKECVASCPTDMFVLSGVCNQCSNNCSTCNSGTNCTLCSGLTYLYNGACIASCPNTAPVIIAGACTPCSTQNCYSCSPSDVC